LIVESGSSMSLITERSRATPSTGYMMKYV